jgi:hypothetical protein
MAGRMHERSALEAHVHMLHAYRLRSPDRPHAPEMLWEWEEPYMNRLLWHAKTFGRTVVHCTFLHWHALAEANQRIWETFYRLRPSHAPWDTWQGWMAAYRNLVATVQEVYEAQHAQKRVPRLACHAPAVYDRAPIREEGV